MWGAKKHILLYLSSYNTLIFLDLFCYKNLKYTGLFSSGKNNRCNKNNKYQIEFKLRRESKLLWYSLIVPLEQWLVEMLCPIIIQSLGHRIDLQENYPLIVRYCGCLHRNDPHEILFECFIISEWCYLRGLGKYSVVGVGVVFLGWSWGFRSFSQGLWLCLFLFLLPSGPNVEISTTMSAFMPPGSPPCKKWAKSLKL